MIDSNSTLDSKVFNSSLVNSATYDSSTQTLTVTLNSGREYTVEGAAPDLWAGFKSAWSAGRFFNEFIKGA